MDTLLEAIDVCDVDGFCYGNYTDEEAGTGCTVIVAPEGATGGVDVRGGAPASRETDLLRPENTVDKVHAVCLSGGSAFGLEAASGVARELESRGIGLPVGPTQVPIVCSSCIFDLTFGDPTVRPDIEAGIAAVCDRDAVIAVAGGGKRELLDRRISRELEELMSTRGQYAADSCTLPVVDTDERYAVAVAAPILSEGDVLGCVLFAAARGGAPAGETERKLAQAVAGFLGKQMES